MKKLFKTYEQKLRIKQKSVVVRTITHRTEGQNDDGTFSAPKHLKRDKTLRWVLKTPLDENNNSFKYTVKYAPYRGKKPPIPERMYNRKRCFQPRRDGYIAMCDAIFQPEQKPKEPFHLYVESTAHEFTEKQLRNMEQYKSFFENWDNGIYSPDDCEELMLQAINGRVEVYQEYYKHTSNLMFLAKAVFIKFLDVNAISDLHKLYLILSEECAFSMCYVEGILRRHYE